MMHYEQPKHVGCRCAGKWYMTSQNISFDKDGRVINQGDSVVFLNAADELLMELPEGEQNTIRAGIGRIFEVQGIDE